MEDNLPPGFRFHPTDEELITYYLANKVSDFGFTCKAIVDVDLNKCEPWDLPAKASMGEKEWYFYNMRDRKYPTGLRTNRATIAGYWKTTGKDKEIFRGEVLIGMKKTLVFYRGRAPKGEKTNWVMHEYRLDTKLSFKPYKEEWVVCRVFQKSIAIKKPQTTSPDSPDETNTNSNDFGDIELPNLHSSLSTSPEAGFSIPSLQTYPNLNMTGSTNLNLNWAREIANLPSFSWPSSLLNPNLNTTVNSLLLKALQFRSSTSTSSSSNTYQPTDQTTTRTDYSFLANQQAISVDNMFESIAQEDQQNTQQLQEQPFNLDSMW